MGLRSKKDALLEEQPALGAVLSWWAEEAPLDQTLSGLRKEVARLRRSPKRLEAVWNSAAWFLGLQEGDKDLTKLDPSLHRLLWNYAIADEMAIRYQRIQQKSSHWIVAFVAVVATGFWILKNAALLLPQPGVAGLSLGATLGSALIGLASVASFWERSRFQRNRSRFLLSRTLAETLRVDLAQRLAGTKMDTLEEFVRQHDILDDKAFSKAVLMSALECAKAPLVTPQSGGMELAKTIWLEDQLRYFGDPKAEPGTLGGSSPRVERERRFHERAERRFKRGVRGAVFYLILSQILWGLTFVSGLPELGKTWAAVGQAFSDFFFGLCGFWAGYHHQISALHAVTAQKYHRARLFLVDAVDALRKEAREEERKAIFARAGKLALAETADWGVHQREHTPQVSFR